MERTEPTFVPEWLKNNGSLTTTTSHQSSLQSDDQNTSKFVRNKSLDNDLGRPTISSYFRRPSSSNGSSHLRSYSSFGRNRDRDYSDPLSTILPSRFEKDGLRRSYSNLGSKRDTWPKKIVGGEKNGRNNNNGKILFERDFPTLGKEGDSEIGRVPSPGLSSVIQSLPVGGSGVIGGDVWTSALVEVPVMVGTNGTSGSVVQQSVQPSIQPTSMSVTTSVVTGRNMAETLAQGPPRVHIAPQVSVGSQRLEERAVKQSRQLIPKTPSMPKALVSNSSDKPKLKVGQLHLQTSHIVNHSPSPRLMSLKSDVTMTSSSSSSSSTVGKLHVLKPSREKNVTITPTPTETSTTPTPGTKLPNRPLVLDRKASEKRPSPQAKSRNDFFNLMRKKSMANNNSTPVTPDNNNSSSSSDLTNDKSSDGGTVGPTVSSGCGGGGGLVAVESSGDGCVILYSEEEEARFLKSLGWEETNEEEGLTEEEINSFYRDVSKYVNLKTGSNFFKGTQAKSLMPLNGDISADTKVDS